MAKEYISPEEGIVFFARIVDLVFPDHSDEAALKDEDKMIKKFVTNTDFPQPERDVPYGPWDLRSDIPSTALCCMAKCKRPNSRTNATVALYDFSLAKEVLEIPNFNVTGVLRAAGTLPCATPRASACTSDGGEYTATGCAGGTSPDTPAGFFVSL